jgi:hypothetical protein
MLIDIAIPEHRAVIKKEAEKILKYKDLRIEIQRMRNVKATVIPVTIVANGIISKSLGQYLSNIPEKHEINEIKKSPIGHCTDRAENANVFHRGNNITCSTNCKYTTVATLCTLETWFVSGI